ncbi:hypothetical protein HG537_0D03450 [Torulaspora globosa]|uniref:3-oxo-5-alpha-steroid 4-dehydrogenase C-terminal domain-containing protein n=1 Tax=Torulaspora globosa TaxID=48254 RepID=A0A7H9HRG2_9SACH|nr:hypothetical protein HG537_0D03450 [Torulaspora sp. CBS 2947]
MTVVIKSRSKSLKDTYLENLDGLTLKSVLNDISKNNRSLNTNRLRLSYIKEGKQVPIVSDAFFQEGTNFANIELYVKDLGPQVSWRLVFVVEYLGPILVHSLLYYLSKNRTLIEKYHSQSKPYNPFMNKLAYSLIMAHYLKREFETLFVHQFSQSTMPLFNIFKNSFHYWVLNGAIAFGYFGYGFIFDDSKLFRAYSALRINNLGALVALFVLAESWVFYVHIKLRLWGEAQKKKGNTTKRVPINNGMFSLLVAPNYTFESWAWIFFSLIFKLNLFSLIFTAVSMAQMYLWAQKKNKKYGTKRAFLIPYVF